MLRIGLNPRFVSSMELRLGSGENTAASIYLRMYNGPTFKRNFKTNSEAEATFNEINRHLGTHTL